MNEKDVITKMQAYMGGKSIRTNKPIINVSSNEPEVTSAVDSKVFVKVPFQEWVDILPQVVGNQFLIDIQLDSGLVFFCVEELDWQTAMNIDMKSIRPTNKNIDYYSEEYERRNTLIHAIIWVADSSTQQIVHNDGRILEKLNYEVLDLLWNKYKAATTITTQEAQRLYESTKKYLNSEAQEGVPIPSIIPETIAICDGWSTLSLKELKEITAGDWERMQIIRMARAELLGVYTPYQTEANSKSVIAHEIKESQNGINLEDWKNKFPIGHPNRPPGA